MGGSEKICIYGFIFWKTYITNSIYISLILCYIFVTESGLWKAAMRKQKRLYLISVPEKSP